MGGRPERSAAYQPQLAWLDAKVIISTHAKFEKWEREAYRGTSNSMHGFEISPAGIHIPGPTGAHCNQRFADIVLIALKTITNDLVSQFRASYIILYGKSMKSLVVMCPPWGVWL